MYRGSDGPEDLWVKNFPGVFLNPDPLSARRDGPNVYGYRIMPGRYFSPDILEPSQKECMVVSDYARKNGVKRISTCKKLLNAFLLNPTESWVKYLSELGYLGFIEYDRVFLFDMANAQYIGKYDFDKKVISK